MNELVSTLLKEQGKGFYSMLSVTQNAIIVVKLMNTLPLSSKVESESIC